MHLYDMTFSFPCHCFISPVNFQKSSVIKNCWSNCLFHAKKKYYILTTDTSYHLDCGLFCTSPDILYKYELNWLRLSEASAWQRNMPEWFLTCLGSTICRISVLVCCFFFNENIINRKWQSGNKSKSENNGKGLLKNIFKRFLKCYQYSGHIFHK